ncbi:hypothetical protein WJX79_001276 [Trebouxia sp. C0005]
MANLMCTCIDRLQHQPHFSSATRLPILMSSYYAISRRVAASKAPRLTFDVFLSYCIFALKKAQCVAMYVNIKQSLLQCLDARLRLG